ncbi:hypothetical protein TorRG33x02_330020 [Trema orientale]|uniref:Uncharacterized protein n=1 Tax=Trema orientale TaxID=63057 RepID=A0A2P5B7W7_TREOI|nr:hypothetical protein TorRG33x02_330020 [Trema orientale]
MAYVRTYRGREVIYQGTIESLWLADGVAQRLKSVVVRLAFNGAQRVPSYLASTARLMHHYKHFSVLEALRPYASSSKLSNPLYYQIQIQQRRSCLSKHGPPVATKIPKKPVLITSMKSVSVFVIDIDVYYDKFLAISTRGC